MFIRISAALAASRAKREDNNEKGFTLIELLVVVLIIGILAAIAIPVYIGQQKSAQDAAAQSNVSNAKLAVVAYYAANPDDSDATVSSADLGDYGWPQGVTDIASSGTYGGPFCVSEKSASSATKFYKATDSSQVDSGAAGC